MINRENAKAPPVNGVSYAEVAALDDHIPSSYAEAATPRSKIPGPTIDLTHDVVDNDHHETHGTETQTPPRSHSPLPTPGEYEGAGQDESPKTPIKRKRPLSRNGNPSGSLRHAFVEDEKRNSGSDQERKKSGTILYEKINHSNGTGHLTSVKPVEDYEEAIKLDKSEARFLPDGQLVLKSGRIPSAGWESSGYDMQYTICDFEADSIVA